MQGLKSVPLVALGSAVVLAGCGMMRYQTAGASKTKNGPDTVIIQKAASHIPDTHTSAPPPFPHQESIAPCKIGVGGSSNKKTIDGTCSTAVRTVGPNKVVTFTETWNAQNYRGAGSPANGLLISVWQITLDPHGKVIQQTHTGDFPPQEAT